MPSQGTLGSLINVLIAVLAMYGDGPVVIADADTGWEMPLYSIEKAANGHYLLTGIGYIDDPAIRNPEKPIKEIAFL